MSSKKMKKISKTELKKAKKIQFKKCVASPSYFMNNYCYIQHPTMGRIKFDLFPFQQDTLQQFAENSWNIILKSRQLGISTLVAGYITWLCTFQADKTVLVIANNKNVAQNMITKVRVMYDSMPEWLKLPLKTDNKHSLVWSNDSTVKASAAGPNAGVSEALSLLVFDQAAVLGEPRAQQIWTAAYPTLSTGGDCIMLSTPRGVGNTFHKLWVKAQQGQSKFNPIKLGWQVHPDRTKEWAQKQKKESGEKKFARQYDCDFAMSGQNFIDQKIVKELRDQHQTKPLVILDNDKLWIWKFPQVDKEYIIAADVARGDGGDYSAFHVIDIQQNQQIAQYKGQINTQDYGQLLVKFGIMYNNAFLIVQNANVGHAVIQAILNLKYKNLYYHKKDYKWFDQQLQSKNTKKNDKQKDIPGFTTSNKTRPLILQKINLVLQSRQFIIHSKRTYNQLDTFVWVNSKPQAMSGYNDDLIMSMAIGVWVRNTSYIISKQSKKFIKERMKSIQSGVHQARQNQQKINTGFFNSRDNYKRGTQMFNVGDQQVDLNRFLFPQKYK